MRETTSLFRCARALRAGAFSVLCFCALPALATQALGVSREAQPAKQCTADDDATVVFQPADTEKLFKCPAGWTLEPTKTEYAYQDNDSQVKLSEIIEGANLQALADHYKLTLPAGGDRDNKAWYYTCKHSVDSSEPPANDSDADHEKHESDSSSTTPSISVPQENELGNGRDDSALQSGLNGGNGGSSSGSSDGSGGRGENETSPEGSLASSGVTGLDGHGKPGPQAEGDTENRSPTQHPAADPEAQKQHADAPPSDSEESKNKLQPEVKSFIRAVGRAASPGHHGANQEKRTSCRITVEVVASTLVECKTGETKTANVSAAGDRVAFKCAAGLSLKPEKLDQVYDDKDGNCASQVALTTLVKGSLFSLADKPEAPAKNTSYVLRVDELPAEQQALCYKCVAASKDGGNDARSEEAAQECRVKIAVSSSALSPSVLSAVSLSALGFGALAGGLFC
ncbi:hypothetical protein BESB_081930 [Besnoitia besnoiti]|uniref:SRS domain-containing protein n=1 Tax=Besnoitia besnoiti TaxID=94643 RepID=A0A2A9M722_BESBE|nr:hypothetical protein BESB_081930 [Besnoitia besnoiti]PFH32994.1 hypothetical protein BESB_081930 [Besnoitia besnoiti]